MNAFQLYDLISYKDALGNFNKYVVNSIYKKPKGFSILNLNHVKDDGTYEAFHDLYISNDMAELFSKVGSLNLKEMPKNFKVNLKVQQLYQKRKELGYDF